MIIDIPITVDLCRTITEKASKRPTHVAAVARGGLIAGSLLSRHWDAQIITIQDDKSRKSLIEISKILNKSNSAHVLIIDDYCDTGYTMSNITNYLFQYSEPDRVTTAVLCSRHSATDLIDIYGMTIDDKQEIRTQNDTIRG